MEKLAWRSSTSQAKMLGTVISITGAMVVIFYKGPSLILPHLRSPSRPQGELLHSTTTHRWTVGGLLLGVKYILNAIWYILQAHIIKEYPAELVVVFFYNFLAAIISGAVSSVAEPNRVAWILKPDISLVAIVYSGVIGSFFNSSILAWILRRKGPFYITMFKPLSIAIAAAMGIIFLGDILHLGSVIGSAMISMGFYAVMWGKVTEAICEGIASPDLESSEKIPLLRAVG